MCTPSPLPARSRRPAGRLRPCAACGESAVDLVLGICLSCRQSHTERLQRARACPEPGSQGAACGLCRAPIDSGYYCAGCQRRFSTVSAHQQRAPGPPRS